MRRIVIALAALGLVTGCELLANSDKLYGPDAGLVGPDAPMVMLILDTSATMKQKADGTWGCCASMKPPAAPCEGYTRDLPCKWNNLRSMLVGEGRFLAQLSGKVRLGLSSFPDQGAATCKAGGIVANVADGDNVAAISAWFAMCQDPSGGAPLTDILNQLKADRAFFDPNSSAPRYAILITDGVPNCNQYPGTCSICIDGTSSDTGCDNGLNCFDDDGPVVAVANLKALGVSTFVVGFGSNLDSSDPIAQRASDLLDRMALAGGETVDRPDGGVGAPLYFQADSDADQGELLSRITATVSQ
jgi:hypothetical protein